MALNVQRRPEESTYDIEVSDGTEVVGKAKAVFTVGTIEPKVLLLQVSGGLKGTVAEVKGKHVQADREVLKAIYQEIQAIQDERAAP